MPNIKKNYQDQAALEAIMTIKDTQDTKIAKNDDVINQIDVMISNDHVVKRCRAQLASCFIFLDAYYNLKPAFEYILMQIRNVNSMTYERGALFGHYIGKFKKLLQIDDHLNKECSKSISNDPKGSMDGLNLRQGELDNIKTILSNHKTLKNMSKLKEGMKLDQNLQADLNPIPLKSHYTIKQIGILKFICSITMSTKREFNTVEQGLRLWAHETTRALSNRLFDI